MIILQVGVSSTAKDLGYYRRLVLEIDNIAGPLL